MSQLFALRVRADGTVVLNDGGEPVVFKRARKALRYLLVTQPEPVRKASRCISGVYRATVPL